MKYPEISCISAKNKFSHFFVLRFFFIFHSFPFSSLVASRIELSSKIMFSRKSNAKSEELRTEGNKFYSQRKFFNALLKYNESLCYAEPASENVGHAYANRSAVYFEMKLYERCLKNVELAKQHRYPENNLEVLNNRTAKCNDLVNNSREKPSDVWNFFKLSYPPNVKLPFVVDCLEAKISEKYGRHLITNQALKVGDIVAV